MADDWIAPNTRKKLELESHGERIPLSVVPFDVHPGHASLMEPSGGFERA